MNGLVINAALRCPSCGYCLNGIPTRGRCPECGAGYVAEGPNVAEAFRRFNYTIPWHWRFGLTPSPDRFCTSIRLAVYGIAMSGLSAAAFVLAQYAGVRLGAPKPWGRSPDGYEFLWTAFGEIGGGWSRPRPWDSSGRRLWAIVFVGELFIAIVIRFWYRARIRPQRAHRAELRCLQGHTAGSVAPALAIPMLILAVWQYWNVSLPGSYGLAPYVEPLGPLLQPLVLVMQGWPSRTNLVNLGASVGLYFGVALAATRLIRRHRRGIAAIHEALSEVQRVELTGNADGGQHAGG